VEENWKKNRKARNAMIRRLVELGLKAKK